MPCKIRDYHSLGLTDAPISVRLWPHGKHYGWRPQPGTRRFRTPRTCLRRFDPRKSRAPAGGPQHPLRIAIQAGPSALPCRRRTPRSCKRHILLAVPHCEFRSPTASHHSRNPRSEGFKNDETERVCLRREGQEIKIGERPRQRRSCQYALKLSLAQVACVARSLPPLLLPPRYESPDGPWPEESLQASRASARLSPP